MGQKRHATGSYRPHFESLDMKFEILSDTARREASQLVTLPNTNVEERSHKNVSGSTVIAKCRRLSSAHLTPEYQLSSTNVVHQLERIRLDT